jgi:hypothetical protein
MRADLGLLILAMAACGARPTAVAPAVGPDVRAKVAQVVLCSTTEAELRGWFGAPIRDGRRGRLRIQDWLLGEHPERVLAVVLDDRGVIVDLDWDTPVGASWLPANLCPTTP